MKVTVNTGKHTNAESCLNYTRYNDTAALVEESIVKKSPKP